MKKIVYFCLILALLLGLSVAASAAGNEKVTVTAGGDVSSDNVLVFTVMVSDADLVNSCTIIPVIPEQFELRYFTWEVQPDFEMGDSSSGYTAQWNEAANINKKLAKFGLKAKNGLTPETQYEISCKVIVTVGTEKLELADVCPAYITAACDHSYVQNPDVQYLKQAGSCTTPSVYYVSCSVCGAAGEETFEQLSEGGHDFSAKVEAEEYLSGEANCQNKLSYYYSCSVCGATGEETFSVEGTGTHDFTAQVETEEYLSDMGDCQNKRQYFYSCTVCGEKSEETFVSEKKFGVHIYDNECDSECNVCGKYQEPVHQTEETWGSDQTGHWKECTVCLEKVDFAEHIPGAEATAEEHQTCTECGYVLAVSDEHQHEYGAEWSSDDKSHWHECSCGGKSDLDVHSWNVIDSEDSSVLTAECLVCGATKEEQLPTIEDTQPTQPTVTQPSATWPTQSTQQDEGGGNGAVIVLAILLVLSLAGNGVLAWMLFGNKKKPANKSNY